ncbi:MAG: bifunctional phosphoribosylaminoimidazolecarboxamide formyltransferase/IMP cyclohydrolase [Polyangiaceae bacterium]|nr:bifunctional phosphoribosylaminoimidazolecarboxamide formyltransferase/IMP cyclohydrolase [Polyangiaceae bacterium]
MPHALLSVSDKTNLVPFAKFLVSKGYTLLASGGTHKTLADANVAVQTVESYTESPEVMGGRVKTLHPRIHGGILARAEDDADLARLGASRISLVVVNLYPFEKVSQKQGVTPEELIENIDIGGPSMVRSAAKNHVRVTVCVDPSDYAIVQKEIEDAGSVSEATRRKLAAKAFDHTGRYDGLIAETLSSSRFDASEPEAPRYLHLSYERAYPLRYGENPQQPGAFYLDPRSALGSLARAESLGTGAKELSYNNLLDADAAHRIANAFQTPAATIIKHTNPCGTSVGKDIVEAFRDAREADPVSAFGGIVGLNRPVDATLAKLLVETFLECIVAPSFEDAALEILRTKKNLRLLATNVGGTFIGADAATKAGTAFNMRTVSGGLLRQADDVLGAEEVRSAKVVTERAPTRDEWDSLDLAWRVSVFVKSNAIVLAKGRSTVGVGAGQMSRVESVKIACEKAGERAQGSCLASDAFFPFPDGVELAASRGVTAMAQPGGSVKDEEVISTANRLGIAMVMTGVRHFRH